MARTAEEARQVSAHANQQWTRITQEEMHLRLALMDQRVRDFARLPPRADVEQVRAYEANFARRSARRAEESPPAAAPARPTAAPAAEPELKPAATRAPAPSEQLGRLEAVLSEMDKTRSSLQIAQQNAERVSGDLTHLDDHARALGRANESYEQAIRNLYGSSTARVLRQTPVGEKAGERDRVTRTLRTRPKDLAPLDPRWSPSIFRPDGPDLKVASTGTAIAYETRHRAHEALARTVTTLAPRYDQRSDITVEQLRTAIARARDQALVEQQTHRSADAKHTPGLQREARLLFQALAPADRESLLQRRPDWTTVLGSARAATRGIDPQDETARRR